MVYMTRTNIDLDDVLVAKVMRIYRLKTKKDAVNFALRKLVSADPHAGMLALEGTGWEGDLDEMRTSRIVEW